MERERKGQERKGKERGRVKGKGRGMKFRGNFVEGNAEEKWKGLEMEREWKEGKER